MKLGSVEGVDPWKDPVAATAAVRAACENGQVIRVQQIDGPVLPISCRDPSGLARMPGPGVHVRLDPAKVVRILGP
jgi:hypothetical protein